MKRHTTLLTVSLLALLVHPVLAKKHQKTELQKKKSEIKTWKKRKTAMQPLQLKDLVEENHRLKTSNRKLAEEANVSKEALEQLIKLKEQLELRSNEQGIREEAQGYLAQGLDGFSEHDWATDKNGQPYIKGLVFKVQIGAYKKRDLSNVIESEKPQEVFEQEQSEGVNMYTLRHFRDYWKANQFKKELRAMGLKDTWIVVFKDGKRISLKEVLQTVIKKK